MSIAIEELKAQIRELSFADKTELLRALIAGLDGPANEGVEQAWLEEAQRRHQEIVNGKVRAVPGDQVFLRLRARLKRMT
jgi:putative addiction module component (TIGR02574 family)